MSASIRESADCEPVCLVVDDEESLQKVIRRTLARVGITSFGCRDTGAMLSELPHRASGIIFLDLVLDNSDAVEAIRELGKRQFCGAVQLMSGCGLGLLHEIRRIGEGYGLRMLPPLQKPFPPETIRAVVRQEGLLDQQRAGSRRKPGAQA